MKSCFIEVSSLIKYKEQRHLNVINTIKFLVVSQTLRYRGDIWKNRISTERKERQKNHDETIRLYSLHRCDHPELMNFGDALEESKKSLCHKRMIFLNIGKCEKSV